MSAALTLTAAGAAAIADGANSGLAGITFTRLALGSGTGTGDQSTRTALDTQRDVGAVTGAASGSTRIALRCDYAPTESYAITEIGLFARVGASGGEFLCAYWIAESAAGAVAAAAPDTALVIAGVVDVVAAAADIDVAVAANIAIGVPANVVYQEHLADYALRTWVTAQIRAIPAPSSVPTGTTLDFAGDGAPSGYAICDGAELSRTTDAALFGVIGTKFGAGDGSTTFNKPDFRRRVAVGAGGTGSDGLPSTVGSQGGSETHSLSSNEMPAHRHASGTYRAPSAGSHGHGSAALGITAGGSHSHGSGALGITEAGDHVHSIGGEYQGDLPSGADLGLTSGANRNTGAAGSHAHDVTGSTDSAGSHTHDVTGSTDSAGSHTHDVAGYSGYLGGGQPHNILQPSLVVTKIIKL